jgi:Mg2+-importing ATPase
VRADLPVHADPPKTGIAQTIEQLGKLSIKLKVITGDNRHVAAHVAEQVDGFAPASSRVLSFTD